MAEITIEKCPLCGAEIEKTTVKKEFNIIYIDCKEEFKRKRWIPCSERLPEKHVEVLAYSPYWGKIVVAMWGGEFWLEQWTDDDLEQSEISHWMPLPEPPEKEAADDA